MRNSICKDQIKNKEVHVWKQTMCYDIAGGFAIRDFDFDSCKLLEEKKGFRTQINTRYVLHG